ncbi:MAG TPA: hypothetical protein VN495_03540 [Candidatus Paceibacterota bacterium]|nr:hypothetical protein [Candidatus Paceibacterota bacterium]
MLTSSGDLRLEILFDQKKSDARHEDDCATDQWNGFPTGYADSYADDT